MELSKRLKAVAELVTAGSIVCDVGCDHGYVSIYLIQEGICPRVIAMDVNAGPLDCARENIRSFCLDEYITTRLSDGVSALKEGEADCLILAGMGGRLVIKILAEGRKKLSGMRELILQPQSDIALVRAFLREEGYAILRENMIYEDGKYYPMMKATCVSENKTTGSTDAVHTGAEGKQDAREAELHLQAYDKYGEYLLKNRHPVLHQFLLWEQERETAISRELASLGEGRTSRHRKREAELERAARVRDCALSYYAQSQS